MKRKIILIGKNEFGSLGEGWYGLEHSPEGVWYRASAPKAEIHLPTPFETVTLSLLVTARPSHTGQPLEVEITSGESGRFAFTLESNLWTIRKGVLDGNGGTTLQIRVKNPWSPDRLYQNGDARSLGILLSAIRIESLTRDSTPEPSLWKSFKD
ncbi:MAG: hypothetical protein RBU29_05060 [bacterium]|nr:hypothetical protein [bacterium]